MVYILNIIDKVEDNNNNNMLILEDELCTSQIALIKRMVRAYKSYCDTWDYEDVLAIARMCIRDLYGIRILDSTDGFIIF